MFHKAMILKRKSQDARKDVVTKKNALYGALDPIRTYFL